MGLVRILLVVAAVAEMTTGISACGTGSPTGSEAGADAGSGGAAGGQAGQATGATAGQAGQGGLGGGGDDIATIMATYKSWQALSDTPVDISAEIAGLCRLPTSAETKFSASIHGGHKLRDWANQAARQGISVKGAGGFSVGATIVKEKFLTVIATGSLELTALGMMIKRPAGFDPAGGDWEFVYWNPTDGVSRGAAQLSTCASCHAGSATDFVFVDESWRTSTPQ